MFPSQKSRDYFEERMRGHTRVTDLEPVSGQEYVIERQSLPNVRLLLCDIYTLGLADYYQIRKTAPEADAIVVVSMWNSYTPEAADQGEEDGVGIFTVPEFMKALHRPL